MTFSISDAARAMPAQGLTDPSCDDDAVPLPPVQDVVGDRLRAVYGEILRDPIPQRFLDLLDRLDGRTGDGA